MALCVKIQISLRGFVKLLWTHCLLGAKESRVSAGIAFSALRR
jgi:hypothetical protein